MKKVFLVMAVSALLVTLGFAQTPDAGSNTDPANVKGCLGGSEGSYTVAEDGTGQIFKITTSSADLKPHVGHDVKLIGHKVSGPVSSGPADNSFAVTEVSMISEHCAGAAAAPVVAVIPPSETVVAPVPDAAAPAAAATVPAVDAAAPAATASPSAEVTSAPAATAPAPAATVAPSAAVASTPAVEAVAPVVTVAPPAAAAPAPAVEAVHPARAAAHARKVATTQAAATVSPTPDTTVAPAADAVAPTATASPSDTVSPPATEAAPAAAPAAAAHNTGSLVLLVSFVVLVIVLGTMVPLLGRWRKRKMLERTSTPNLSFTNEESSGHAKAGPRKVA